MRSAPPAGPWDRLLLAVVALVIIYSLGLVFAGLLLGDTVFDALGFGPADGNIVEGQREYVQLVFGILGAVIIGWMTAIGFIVAGPLRRREAWAWWAIVTSTLVWFVLDTGISLLLGFVGHALFNVAFAVGLAVPLAALKTRLKPS